MRTDILGRTGLRVSKLCLGTVMLGSEGNHDRAECSAIIQRAIDAGINFIDTADIYGGGASESILGEAVKGKRDRVVIATKFGHPSGRELMDAGGSRNWMVTALEASLKRLGTDYIDLYQIHRYDEATDLEEILLTLSQFVADGKVRYIGSSMFSADRIVEAQWLSDRKNLCRFRCEQPLYSVFSREAERFVLPACQRYGMGAVAWGNLESGLLSGKYKTVSDLDSGNRIAKYETNVMGGFDLGADLLRIKLDLVQKLSVLAGDLGLSLPQLATAFAMEHPYITSVIIGPRTLAQLDQLLPSVDVRLSAGTLDQIDQWVPPGSSVDQRLSPLREVPDGTRTRRSKHFLNEGPRG